MNKSLLIIGASGHGRVVADTAQLSATWNYIAFVDDRYPEIDNSGGWPVVGKVTELSTLASQFKDVIVGVGNNLIRLDLQKRARELGFSIATVIHPSATVSKKTKVGDGSVLFANTVVNIGTSLGEACIINTAASIDHDNQIGDGVHVSPGANLAGNVSVGSCTWIGIGSSVVHGIFIGADVTIGAGSVVSKNVDDNVTVVGNPARVLEK